MQAVIGALSLIDSDITCNHVERLSRAAQREALRRIGNWIE
jgi:hypothetical protein